jgi:hypothetical protein
MASPRGLELVWTTAESCDQALLRPRVRMEVVGALGAILRSDPRSFAWIENRLDLKTTRASAGSRDDSVLMLVLVESIAAAQRPAGQRTLELLLRREPQLEAAILERMAELERLFPWRLEGSLTAHLDRLGLSMDWRDRRLAATLASEVQEVGFVRRLIELVEDHDARVRRAAQLSLETIARLPLGKDGQAWAEWYERERSWWESEAETLSEALTGADAGPANAALRALSEHPLYRHDAARRISSSLMRQPDPIGVNACAVLESLGSRAAIPGLFGALEHGDPLLRNAAWRSWSELTEDDQLFSLDAWRELLAE